MNCNSIEEKIIAIARGELLDAATKQDALDHAASCSHCMERLLIEEKLTARLKEFAITTLQESASLKVESVLSDAFKAYAARQNQSAAILPRRKSQRGSWVIGGAIAASVLVAIGLLAQSFFTRHDDLTAVVLTSDRFVEIEDVIDKNAWKDFVVIKRIDSPSPPPLSHPKVNRRIYRNSTREIRETEVATEFMPLMQDGSSVAFESGQIVRVKLPRSALLACGLQIDIERVDENVTADVMLSEEGIAKAIRFVHTSDKN